MIRPPDSLWGYRFLTGIDDDVFYHQISAALQYQFYGPPLGVIENEE
jgi:hypothetical protein